jgi:hypothetical protein
MSLEKVSGKPLRNVCFRCVSRKTKTVLKPTQVGKLNKQRLGQTPGKGTRQITRVTSEEARPL